MFVEGVVRNEGFFAIGAGEFFVIRVGLDVHFEVRFRVELPVANVAIEAVFRAMRLQMNRFVLFIVRFVAYLANEHWPHLLVVIGRRVRVARFDWLVHAPVEAERLERREIGVANLANVNLQWIGGFFALVRLVNTVQMRDIHVAFVAFTDLDQALCVRRF